MHTVPKYETESSSSAASFLAPVPAAGIVVGPARIERHAQVATLGAEWDALADRTGGNLWVRPGWVEAWWRAFGEGDLEIIALRRGSELVAVLPLRRRLGALTSTTNWHTPEFDAVGLAEDVAELLSLLLRSHPRRVSFAFVDAASGAAKTMRVLAERRRLPMISRPLEHSPFIDTRAGWDEYLRARDAKFLRDLRRRARMLDAIGPVTFHVVSNDARLDELVDEGFAVERLGWKGEEGSAVASDPATMRFYREIAHWAAARGELRLGFLRVDGRAIAFDFSVESNGVHYLLKTGFDPALSRCAPGKLLRYRMIEHAFTTGILLYEFLGTDNPWKYEWTQTVRTRSLIQCFSRSLAGRADWALFALARPAVKKILSLAGR